MGNLPVNQKHAFLDVKKKHFLSTDNTVVWLWPQLPSPHLTSTDAYWGDDMLQWDGVYDPVAEGWGVGGGHAKEAVGLWGGDERARDSGFDDGGERVGAVRALNNNFGAFEMHHWHWHNHLSTILKRIHDDDQQQHQMSCVSVMKALWTLAFHCWVETWPTESSLTSLPYALFVEDVQYNWGVPG